MRPDLMSDVATVLAAVGGMLQFFRAQKKISDATIVPVGFVIATVVWVLAVDWSIVKDWQGFILKNVTVVIGLVASLFGGTFLVSRGADAAAAMGAPPSHPLVPMTDSK